MASGNRGATPGVIGCKHRLGESPEVVAWTPPSRDAVEALPAVPEPQAKGWTQSDLWPTNLSEPRREPPVRVEAPNPQPVATPQRNRAFPEGVEAGSTLAYIWEHHAQAAQLLHAWLGADDPAAGTGNAAVLILALGKPIATEVMRHLDLSDAEEIAKAIVAIDTVAADLQLQVLERFRQQLQSGQVGALGGGSGARNPGSRRRSQAGIRDPRPRDQRLDVEFWCAQERGP